MLTPRKNCAPARGVKTSDAITKKTACGDLPRLMTEAAIDTHFLHAVALHTAAHRDVALAVQFFPLGNFSVTVLARVAGRNMGPMAECDVGRDFVHAHPRQLAFLLRGRRKLLDCRALFLD